MPDPFTKLSPPLRSALLAIRAATRGMTDDQLVWHPQAKWSAAEILEHLSLAYSRTSERMKPLLEQELPEVRRRNFREWIGGVIVLKLGRIPAGRKAPEALLPRGMNPGEAQVLVEDRLCQLDAVIEQCEKRFGAGSKVLVHSILGPLSTSEWRRFHYVHTLHHMKQIAALRSHGQQDHSNADQQS